MRWQELDVLPPLDLVVLIWVDDRPALAARQEDDSESPGWHWAVDSYRDERYSAAAPLRWANITPPRIA